MKRLVVFFALLLALVQVATAEVDLEIVWKRYMYETQTYIDFAKFSADGNYVYCAVNGNIQVLDASNGKFTTVFKNDSVSGIYEMQISKAGNLILTRDGGGAVNIWDVKQEKAIKYLSYSYNSYTGVFCCDISPDEKYLYLGVPQGELGQNKFLIVYNLVLDKEINRIPLVGHPSKIKCSNDGKTVAVGVKRKDSDGNEFDRLTLYDAETMKEITIVQDIAGQYEGYRHINFSNNDHYLSFVRAIPYYGYIYDINNKNIMINSKINMQCFHLSVLPDNYHFVSQYDIGDFNFKL